MMGPMITLLRAIGEDKPQPQPGDPGMFLVRTSPVRPGADYYKDMENL